MAEKEYLGRDWLARIKAQEKKRDDGWGKDAEAAEKAYSQDTDLQHGKIYDFNIFHSNVETIAPAVFNSPPLPDIRERHAEGDTVARTAADMLERLVSVQCDDGALVQEVEGAVKDALIAGRGIVRVRFDMDDAGERVFYEVVPWRDYVEGPAKRFGYVPWMAFRHRLDREEAERVSDKDTLAKQPSYPQAVAPKDNDIVVWELWKRAEGKVCFIREEDGALLSEKDDPLGLAGFFPVAQPLQPLGVPGKRDPVVPFMIYRRLADELDATTRRINRIIEGLKVRGIIVTGADDIMRLSEAGDNELVPVSGVEGIVSTGGLSKAIEWWPVDKAIVVLKELYLSREQTKQSIYEITGISDIVRGASEASETATAQQIKTQWGSLRIRKLQGMVERMIRDLFVMTVELIASRFSPETMAAQSGMPLDPQVLQLIADPRRHYRVDVESDSTVRADLTRNRGEMGQFLEGTASYFQVMGPLVMQQPAITGPVVTLYSNFARQFSLGRQAEAALDEMVKLAKQAAQQPQPNPEAEAAKAEAEAKAAELQARQQEMMVKAEEAKARFMLDRDKTAAELKLKEAELGLKGQDRQLKALDIQLKRQQLGLEAEKASADLSLRAEQQATDAAFKAEELDIEREQQRAAKIGNE